ncbi:DUF7169 domain-containing protein [Micromonospora sediminicola]|uniref:DUF7169 domain-containing protein n=1 Tax=Micromonospora sediminicola TaxID=946078 RepID=UPI0037908C4E
MRIADLDADRDAIRFAGLLADLRRELDGLEALLPAAIDAQWTTPPTPRPREDTSERMKNKRSEPTADIALDPDRLQLRQQLVRSAHVLRGGVLALAQVRQDVGGALTPWVGEESEHD